MSVRFAFVSIISLIALTAIFSATAQAQKTRTKINSKLAKQSTVSLDQARRTALNTAPGSVEEEELEKERGVLVYSFDIRNSKGTISEVQIDAKTGAVVSSEEETKADEEREKREDAKRSRTKKPNGKN